MSIWNELRERKFVEWIIAYLAGAWLLLQVADFMRENFDWSPAFVRVLTVVLAFGFVALLIIAWFHGRQGSQRTTRVEMVALFILVVIAVGAAWYVARLEVEESVARGNPASVDTTGSPVLLTAFDPATAPGSIAVLPFVNMTPDEHNDYLSDGITEDIIAQLGKSTGLRVISRTSVMHYRGTTKTIPEIGAELGVSAILEGSVRVQDDKVRIVAQLIDVASDAHLWTNTYDRDLKDIFAIQSAVAQDIAIALNATLLPQVLAADGPQGGSQDPDAYRLYSRGKALADSPAPADRRLAIAYLDSAIQKDSGFAEAYAALANLQTPVMLDVPTPPSEPGARERVTATAEKALSLNPRLSEARSAWAMQHALQQGDMEGAEQAVREAVTTNPSSVSSRMRYVQILASRGRTEEAQRELQTLVKLDPMSSTVNAKAGEIALAMGKHEEAETFIRHAMELDSTAVFPHITLAMLETDRGHLDAAITEARKAVSMAPDDPAALSALGYILGTAGRTGEAMRIVDRLQTQVKAGKAPQTAVAQVQVALGDVKELLDGLLQAAGDPRERMLAMANPQIRKSLDQLRGDSTFGPVVDSIMRRTDFRRRPQPGDTVQRPRPGRGASPNRDGA